MVCNPKQPLNWITLRERTCLAEDYVAITLLSCLDKAGANKGREDPALPGVHHVKPFYAVSYDLKEWQKFPVQQQRGKQAAMARCPNEHLRTNRPREQIIPAAAAGAAAGEAKPPLLGSPGTHGASRGTVQTWHGAAQYDRTGSTSCILFFFFLRCKCKVCISNT